MSARDLLGRISTLVVSACFAALSLIAQTSERYVGTVLSIGSPPSQIEVNNDLGASQTLRVTSETLFQCVAPGAKDLKDARTAGRTDVSPGDRVLVALQPGTVNLLRLVIMPATEIAKRNEAEREDWRKRGIVGVVSGVVGNHINIQIRSTTPGSATTTQVVQALEKTVLRRYMPESVKFADAVPAKISEISPGDQLRARGTRSEHGPQLLADKIVFGTFVTKIGKVTAIDPVAGQLTITNSASKQPLSVRLVQGSQVKRMPSMPFPGPDVPNNGMPAAPAGRQEAVVGGMPGPHPPDVNQMLESMPTSHLEDVQLGETIIVSATKNDTQDHVTAITILANADPLLRMIAMFSGAREQAKPGGPAGGMDGINAGAASFSLDALQLPGMMQ